MVGNPVLLQWATTEHKDDDGRGGYGALMGKDLDEACELLEEMASNDFQWQVKKVTPKKVEGVHVLDAITVMQAQLRLLRKQLGTSNISVTQTQTQICDFC